MWSSFIVYFKATGPFASANPNEGLWITAVASAAAGAAYATANQEEAVALYGAGELRTSSKKIAVPHNALPGVDWYDEDAETLQTTPIVALPLQAGFRLYHERLHELSRILQRVGPNYPKVDVDLAHDLIFAGHQGAFVIWGRVVAGNLTAVQAGQWLHLSAGGFADTFPPGHARAGQQIYNPDDPETYFEIVDRVRLAAGDSGLTVPGPVSVISTHAATHASLPFGTRLTLAQMLDPANTPLRPTDADPPTVEDLDRGRWIDRVTA